MQYILSEGEYKALQNVIKERSKAYNEELQALCTLVAKYVQVSVSWKTGPDVPWGCILLPEGHGRQTYCDHCPAQKMCPHPYKDYSK